MVTLADIFRHPIKAHGSERLTDVTLALNATLPWDRVWAIAHSNSKADGRTWARCGNFTRGAHIPTLMAIRSTFDDASGQITLTHPDRPAISVNPDRDGDAIIEWVSPIIPSETRQPERVIRAASAREGQGLTDNPAPFLSLLNHASLRALGQKAGRQLSMLRFRGNLWVDGAAPWEEFDWVGKDIRIGSATLRVEERIDRCLATTANPETGRRDTPVLDILEEGWGHIDFGVFARVTSGGTVNVGDPVEVMG
ncbi:MAG: MOSC domain-containing protein [Pseudomonadota bacterium]